MHVLEASFKHGVPHQRTALIAFRGYRSLVRSTEVPSGTIGDTPLQDGIPVLLHPYTDGFHSRTFPPVETEYHDPVIAGHRTQAYTPPAKTIDSAKVSRP